MPYTPTGPALTQALRTLAGANPFDQTALLRLYRAETGPIILRPETVTVLQRAEGLDAVALDGHVGSAG